MLKSQVLEHTSVYICPYVYLAHYDLMKTAQNHFKQAVSPYLCRLSVGLRM